MTDQASTTAAAIEAARDEVLTAVNASFEALLAKYRPPTTLGLTIYKTPSVEDARDPRNKNGVNLTERGAEILYRLFDDDAGYNRAARMMSITQMAAKNRKRKYLEEEGGRGRTKRRLDIDTVV